MDLFIINFFQEKTVIDRNGLVSFTIIFLIIFGNTPNIQLVDGLTTEVVVNSNPLNIPTDVSFVFWGYTSEYLDIKNELEELLPKQIIHENDLNTRDELVVQPLVIQNYLYHYNYKFNYQFSLNPNGINSNNELIDLMNQTATIGESIAQLEINDELVAYDGWSIPISSISDELKEQSSSESVTIHILDFRALNGQVNQNSSHWFRVGITSTIDFISQDMRNMGLVDDRSIFYDPSAIAPLFENESFEDYENNSSMIAKYIAPRLTTILEKLVVSSPQFIEYPLALENDIHIAQITIIANSSDNLGKTALQNAYYTEFVFAIDNLLPYANIEFSQILIRLNEYTQIQSFLTEHSTILDNVETIIIDGNFVEGLKNLIRSDNSLYENYPKNYYYPLFIFADSTERQYLVETENGDIVEYEVGKIGFGLINMKDWDPLDRSYNLLHKELQVFGKMLGFTEYNGFISQFPSVFSDYGMVPTWDRKYNSLEIENLAIKLGGLYNKTTLISISLFREALNRGIYSWVNTTSLDIAQTESRKGDILFKQKLFLDATEKYIEAFDLWVEAASEINGDIKTARNSIYFIILMSMFGYIIYALFSSRILLDEYKKRYKVYFNKKSN